MRELTLDELSSVAGGYYQQSSDDGTGGGGGGGSTDPGSGSGGGQTPPLAQVISGVPVPWDSVLGDLQTFFDDMSNAASEYTGQQISNTQNSNYFDEADVAPLDGFFVQEFGSEMDPVQYEAVGGNFYNFLTDGIDPEFLLASYTGSDYTFQYSGGSATVSVGDGQQSNFHIDGLDLIGTWHSYGSGQTPPPSMPGDIEVDGSGGYWSFDYTGSPFDPTGTNPAAPNAPITATHAISADQAEQDAAQHRALLDSQLHTFLNQHGGHYTVTFKGPNGTTGSFDLAEYVGILDKYSISGTSGVDFGGISGGAGEVVQLSDGSYQSLIDNGGLEGYDMLQGGLDYLVLHEVSHKLSIAMSYTQSVHDAFMTLDYATNPHASEKDYTGTTGFDGSSALYMSESYANNIALAVEDLINVTHMASPGGGTVYSGTYGGH